MEHARKVLVALSGGVDSSVAAALLKQQGYQVEGAFMVTWQAPWLPCTWPRERLDAMRVAARLQIPFHTIDVADAYERDVVQYLIREYQQGRTPNPDVMCNRYVKFGALLSWARTHGFDFIATGHYAQRRAVESNGEVYYQLCAAQDAAKDQTYFLWTLTQEQLSHALFPIGHLVKKEVRELARTFGLPTATKHESQGVCFLGEIDMAAFVSAYVPKRTGPIYDEHGRVVGSHDGAWLYTIGQRHGLRLIQDSASMKKLYVTAKDIERNTLTVTTHDTAIKDLSCKQVRLHEVHWIGPWNAIDTTCLARYRHRQTLQQVTVSDGLDGMYVHFNQPQEFIAPGQSLVLYDRDVCYGGGLIV